MTTQQNPENLPALVIANETIAALDRAATTGLIAQKEASQFKKMALIAGSIQELRALLTPQVMKPIMALQNTSIGFLTDRPNGGYDVDTVRDCLIEATLTGVFPVGNEFNIISARCYTTKEGFGHKLRDIFGLQYIITPGIPRNVSEAGAVVKMRIEWTYNGQKSDRELEFAIRVNKGMGADAIIGKATRKARAWLFTAVTGQEVGEGDVGDSLADGAIDIEIKKSPFEMKPEENPLKPTGTDGNLPM